MVQLRRVLLILVAGFTASTDAFAALGRRSAAPYKSPYIYTGSSNGSPGNGKGGQLVPDPNDKAHQYTALGPGDLRGPCPGLNTLANHNFISHDGLTTWGELVSAMQNVFNIGYDLAVVLTTLGISNCGDVVTGKLSISIDQTSRTSVLGLGLNGPEPGLNAHNKFESDTSLTRNDLYPSGDNFSFNGTMYGWIVSQCGNLYDFNCIAKLRYGRYKQSLATNPTFYFGTRQLLMYGAVSFIYEVLPSLGNQGIPDLPMMNSFFGAVQSGNTWTHIPERIPPNWRSRPTPYSLNDVLGQIGALWTAYPVAFGGSIPGQQFQAITGGGFLSNGSLPLNVTPTQIACLLYSIATDATPDILGGVESLLDSALTFVTGKLNPIFGPLGCPLISG